MAAFRNSYDDTEYAGAYAKLEFPGTYYLAFRDLPDLVARHAEVGRALDFGCGSGRSLRFLRHLGFDAVGVDIAEAMIFEARTIDPSGDYRQVADADLSQFDDDMFDLVLSAFTFDNIPEADHKALLMSELSRVTKPAGKILNIVSAPEIYVNEWASFSTTSFPENRNAKSGGVVRIIVTALEDRRPVEDVLCLDKDYRDIYRTAGLLVVDVHKPLGRTNDPCVWVNELTTPPWTIYVLAKA